MKENGPLSLLLKLIKLQYDKSKHYAMKMRKKHTKCTKRENARKLRLELCAEITRCELPFQLKDSVQYSEVISFLHP